MEGSRTFTSRSTSLLNNGERRGFSCLSNFRDVLLKASPTLVALFSTLSFVLIEGVLKFDLEKVAFVVGIIGYVALIMFITFRWLRFGILEGSRSVVMLTVILCWSRLASFATYLVQQFPLDHRTQARMDLANIIISLMGYHLAIIQFAYFCRFYCKYLYTHSNQDSISKKSKLNKEKELEYYIKADVTLVLIIGIYIASICIPIVTYAYPAFAELERIIWHVYLWDLIIGAAVTVLHTLNVSVTQGSHTFDKHYLQRDSLTVVLLLVICGNLIRWSLNALLLIYQSNAIIAVGNGSVEGFLNCGKFLISETFMVVLSVAFGVTRSAKKTHEYERTRLLEDKQRTGRHQQRTGYQRQRNLHGFEEILIEEFENRSEKGTQLTLAYQIRDRVFLLTLATTILLLAGYNVVYYYEPALPALFVNDPIILVAKSAAFLIVPLECVLYIVINFPVIAILCRYLAGSFPHSEDKIHIHKVVAYNLLVGIIVHTVAHITRWIISGDGKLLRPTIDDPNRMVQVYGLQSPAVWTGFIMLILISIIIFIGIKRRQNIGIHVLLAGAVPLVHFYHGHQTTLGPAIGDISFMATFIICVLLRLIYQMIRGDRQVEPPNAEIISRVIEDGFEKRLIKLVFKVPNISSYKPGTFINLSIPGSSLFHPHSFTVFDILPATNEIVLLIENDGKLPDSWTSRLYNIVESGTVSEGHWHIAGPYAGPFSRIQDLDEGQTGKDIVLASAGVSITGIFPLLKQIMAKQLSTKPGQESTKSDQKVVINFFYSIKFAEVIDELESVILDAKKLFPNRVFFHFRIGSTVPDHVDFTKKLEAILMVDKKVELELGGKRASKEEDSISVENTSTDKENGRKKKKNIRYAGSITSGRWEASSIVYHLNGRIPDTLVWCGSLVLYDSIFKGANAKNTILETF